MKKIFSVIILCMLLLCGCSDRTKLISGWITGYTKTDSGNTVVIIETDSKKEYAVVVTESTFVFSWVENDKDNVEKIKNGTAENLCIEARYRGGIKSIATEKGDIKGVTAENLAINTVLVKNVKTLNDGTSVDAVSGSSNIIYQLSDGTQLLRVNTPTGPDNVYVGSSESFAVFNEAAQQRVRAYYDSRGLLYDEDEYLEKACAAYKKYGEDFNAYFLEQCIVPCGSNDSIICFLTSVTIPDGEKGRTAQELRLGDIFDRETGEHISGYDIFSCDIQTAMDVIADAEFEQYETADEDLLKEQMKAAIQPEYIILWNDNIEISFPAGTLDSQEHVYLVGIEYTDNIKAIMHDWAIPDYDG